jgi:hypothetical protein
VERIPNEVWLCGNDNLMIKRWTHLFNPEKEFSRFQHLWVLMSGCPLAFWNLEAFKAMGDALGKFLHVDLTQMSGQDRRIGKILVEIDLQKGLPEFLEIEWRGIIHIQKLDY